MADTMDAAMNTAATNSQHAGINVMFSDPRGDFQEKAICGDQQQINPIVTDLTRGDDPHGFAGFVMSAQSFHPTIGGAAVYAGRADKTLQLMGE